MALATQNSLFLHIPKTGGMFVRHALKICNIPNYEIGDQHSHFPYLLKFNDEDFYKRLNTFVFVRNPLSWYQSRWAFRVKYGWKSIHPLDYNCASNDFKTFVGNSLRYMPNGWLTWEYLNYIDTVPGGIKHVGRLEKLTDDLAKILKAGNERISVNAINNMPRINDSDMDGHSSGYYAKYTKDLARRVMAVESEILRRYYHDIEIDIDKYCE